MPTVRVDPRSPDLRVIRRAADLLRAGELVAFPTETVYGVGANALDDRAVRKIFDAKGRPSYNPVIVHVSGADEVSRVAAAWPASAQRLAERFWPGPLTIVLPKRSEIPDAVTAGLPSVAVRVPAHPVALALLRATALPVAAPSANRSTEVSPTAAHHVEKSLAERVALIVDAGPTIVGIESTVVDLSRAKPTLLRPGGISVLELEAIIGPIERAVPVPTGDAPRPAPGMMDRHYAPRASVILYDASNARDRARAVRCAREETERGGRVGALVRRLDEAPDAAHAVVMPETPNGYARRLYAALHELDDAGCTLIVVERVPQGEAWAAVRDRLERGAQ
jgi:L-threonylcarbamoyladenylate synthase